MNRDDFEWLMEHIRFFLTEDYIPGPPDLPIDQEKWNEWIEAGIVSNPEMYEKVQLPKQGLITRPWVYYNYQSSIYVIHNDNSPRRDRDVEMVTRSMKLFQLDLANLLTYTAKNWGLQPDIGQTVGRLYKIGWRTGNTLVVIYESHEYDGEFCDEELLGIKDEIGAEILYVITLLSKIKSELAE